MPDPSELLVKAFGKFQAAGFSVAVAKSGLHGFWVETSAEASTIPSPLERAMASSRRWADEYPSLQNPYDDVSKFLSSGASLGRWENNILDVFMPGGNRCGIPLASFLHAASNNSFKPNPLRGSA